MVPGFLYDLPLWFLAVLISGLAIVVTLAAYAGFRRIVRREFDSDDRGVAMTLLGVVATITSLLLAFSAVSVWESFQAADEAVVHEADTIAELGRDLAVFDSAESRHAREVLRQYIRLVADKEWEDMRTGHANAEAWASADEIFRAVGMIEPDTGKRQALLPEIWARTNELVGHRRDRLYTSESEVPATLWIVVLAGCVLTMVNMFVLPPSSFNIGMIVALAFSLGLVFFFVIAMDRPFAGRESISAEPFHSALENMRQWDEEERR
jgi:hypothetical protein